MDNWSAPGSDAKRRRSNRVILSIPVTVSGDGAKGSFSEEARTLVINVHGALVALQAKLANGQQVKLKSPTSPKEELCKVVFVGPTVQGKTQFGIEFLEPVPDFWRVAFPPENWSPALLDEGERPVKTSKS